VLEVVATASAELIALSPLMSSEAGLNDRVGGLVAPLGLPVIAAVSATVPLNPFDGSTLMYSVFPVVAPGAMVSAPAFAFTLKPGGFTAGDPERSARIAKV
jgi:hypothetical protein